MISDGAPDDEESYWNFVDAGGHWLRSEIDPQVVFRIDQLAAATCDMVSVWLFLKSGRKIRLTSPQADDVYEELLEILNNTG